MAYAINEVFDLPPFPAPSEFVMFMERNHKENEMFCFYLQWNGNEEALTKLANFINQALYDDMIGDYSEVSIDIDTKIPESAVDLHCKIHDMNCFSRMFQKCVGQFKYPLDGYDPDKLDEIEIAKLCDETFFTCRISRMFH